MLLSPISVARSYKLSAIYSSILLRAEKWMAWGLSANIFKKMNFIKISLKTFGKVPELTDIWRGLSSNNRPITQSETMNNDLWIPSVRIA